MGLFRRRKHGQGTVRRANSADITHLEQFAQTRRGVEAYVEPRTTVTETTIVFVASDGEWTRRRIDGPAAARELGRRLAIPVYDVAAVGYPKRMREWTARRKASGDAGAQQVDGPPG